MKEFDIEQAKAGKPVCTRGGAPVRIICLDRDFYNYPIVALLRLQDGDKLVEKVRQYTKEGAFTTDGIKSEEDLMMATEKKEGWVNIYKSSITNERVLGILFTSKSQAIEGVTEKDRYITTIRIEWEE